MMNSQDSNCDFLTHMNVLHSNSELKCLNEAYKTLHVFSHNQFETPKSLQQPQSFKFDFTFTLCKIWCMRIDVILHCITSRVGKVHLLHELVQCSVDRFQNEPHQLIIHTVIEKGTLLTIQKMNWLLGTRFVESEMQ